MFGKGKIDNPSNIYNDQVFILSIQEAFTAKQESQKLFYDNFGAIIEFVELSDFLAGILTGILIKDFDYAVLESYLND